MGINYIEFKNISKYIFASLSLRSRRPHLGLLFVLKSLSMNIQLFLVK